MSQRIEMNHVALNDIKQTQIDDKGNKALCLGLTNIQIAASILRAKDKSIAPLTLKDVDAIVDKAVANGGFADKDKDGNSDNGWVLSHEKIAEAAGLFGYTKIYEKINKERLFALLQWGSLVELRDEGHHSLIATGWYQDENGNFFCTVSDPWPYSNDTLLDCQRWTTLRKSGDKLVDSRTIELIGFYVNPQTNWL
jgi:hypothetical protein